MLALSALLPTVAPSQVPSRQVPRPTEFLNTQDDSLFSLTRSQEDIHGWEQALVEYEGGDHAAAVERLQKLLQEEIGGVVPVGPDRYLGLRLAVVQTLANLSPAGMEAYEALVQREAGALAGRPPQELSPEQLLLLAEKFPAAIAGRRARQRLGDLALERGDGLQAAAHYRLLLDAAPIGSRFEAMVRQLRECADALVRPQVLRERSELPPGPAAVLEVLPAAADRTDWPAFGGGADGTLPMRDPAGRPVRHDGDEISAPGFDYGLGGTYAMQPVGDLEAVFVNNGLELLARDPLRGDLLWASASPLRDLGNVRSMRDYSGAINQNMVLAAACEGDVVIAALQVPDESSTVRYQNAFTIMTRLPERRLFAFHRATGKLLWSHFDQLDGAQTRRFRGHSNCGPPLIVGDTVYAPVHDRAGAIAFYLGAYDLHTGEPLWRRLICSSQQEVNMFGNARMEFAASPLCAADGTLFGCSNLGVAYAIDRLDGRVRWISSYEVIRMPATHLHAQEYRPVYFQNSSPVVAEGVLCCTPLDSANALAFDAEDGRPLWRLPHQAQAGGNNDVRWLFGASGGEFLFAGAGVVAVPARPTTTVGGLATARLVRGREFLGADDRGELPRPALTDRWIWYPGQARISVFDVEGNLAPQSAELRLEQPGNLLLVDGIVVSLCNRAFEVLLDAEALQQEAEKRLRKANDDPLAILRLCRLRGALPTTGDDATLEQLYQRGLAACIARGLPASDPLRATFQRQLFHNAMARARGTDARSLLRAARDLAPDAAAFVTAQSALIAELADDQGALLRELDLLQQRAGDQTARFADAGGSLPVAAYVLWRRAQLLEAPAARIACWQQLLEQHGEATIQRRSATDLATRAIAQLIQQYGQDAYAEVEQRAAAALADAGSDRANLRSVSVRFPHSASSAAASQRLLDLAVAAGDLGSAVDVLMVAVRSAEPAPGLLRRVLEAARLRGNLALARALAERLLATAGGEASDWPADGGRRYRDALAPMLPGLQPATAPVELQPPAEVLASLPNPGPRVGFRVLPLLREEGFTGAAAATLFATAGDQLHAIDLDDPRHPTLFTREVGFLERLWQCGNTLLVSDLVSLVAIDARTGALQWHMANSGQRYIECLGVVDGVLQLTRQSGDDDGQLTLLGVEPLTGRTLFSRQLPGGGSGPPPKPTASDLLLVQPAAAGAAAIDRLDPLTGRARASIALEPATLQALGLRPEVLGSRLFPQTLAADRERVFLAVDGSIGDSLPRVAALTPAGSSWTWSGNQGRRLLVSACRGDRLLLVEAGSPGGGRALVLDARTGEPKRELPLGDEAQPLNWQRLWQHTPAPAALLCADLDDRNAERRLICIAVDDDLPSFVQPLGGSTEEVVRYPWLGSGLLVYGQRSGDRSEPMRLVALRLQDRGGALPGGAKSIRLPGATHEMSVSGAYTVVVTERGLFVLGDPRSPR